MKFIVLLSLIFVFAQTSLTTIHYHYHSDMSKNAISHKKSFFDKIYDCQKYCGKGYQDCFNQCLNGILSTQGRD